MSEHDRRAMERLARVMVGEESTDEGSLVWRHEAIEAANEWRAAHGIPPLETEGEMHRRARALGLLERAADGPR